MSPYQVTLTQSFGEVILLDVSEARNCYKMALTTIMVVNGENQSRSVAYTLTDTQTTAAFVWIFEQYSRAVYGTTANVPIDAMFMDRATAMVNACNQVWLHVFHGICLWHLEQNLICNLVPLLRGLFTEFMDQFWRMYGMGSSASFDNAWRELIANFLNPAAEDYLCDSIYRDRKKWAWAWVGPRFSVGMRTTRRVEAEHRTHRGLGIGPLTTITELFDKLSFHVDDVRDQEYDRKLTVLHPPPTPPHTV
jgi:hypothetical protein